VIINNILIKTNTILNCTIMNTRKKKSLILGAMIFLLLPAFIMMSGCGGPPPTPSLTPTPQLPGGNPTPTPQIPGGSPTPTLQLPTGTQSPGIIGEYGDSITWGQLANIHNGQYGLGGYLLDYPQLSGWTIINKGVSGSLSGQLIDRYVADTTLYKPRYAIILVGTNDIDHGGNATQIINNLTTLYTMYLANGSIPVLVTIPANGGTTAAGINDTRSAVNQWIRSYAAQNNLPLIDLWKATVDPDQPDRMLMPLYSWDWTHLTDAGYQQWADNTDPGIFTNTQRWGVAAGI
jgi:acyl-CoA thioesterase I